MQIEFEERLIKQLQAISERQHRDLNEVAQEAVKRYIDQQSENERFDALIDRIMQEHTELINALAKDDGPLSNR